METSGSIVAGLAGRYATALFQLARDSAQIETVGSSLSRLKAALDQSADFAQLVSSPLVSRAEGSTTALAIADSLKVDPLTRNFLGVLAKNRRLPHLANVIRDYQKLSAAHRGETTADVTSAHPLTDEQVETLKQKLRNRLGRDVTVDLTVDPSILGGLVVRVGSRMIDSSLKTKLDTLGQAMKG